MTNATTQTKLTADQNTALENIALTNALDVKALKSAVKWTLIDSKKTGIKAFDHYVILGKLFGEEYQSMVINRKEGVDKPTGDQFNDAMASLVFNSVKKDEINYSIRLAGYAKSVKDSDAWNKAIVDTDECRKWYVDNGMNLSHPKLIVSEYNAYLTSLIPVVSDSDKDKDKDKDNDNDNDKIDAGDLDTRLTALDSTITAAALLVDKWTEKSDTDTTFSPERASVGIDKIRAMRAKMDSMIANLELVADKDAIQPENMVDTPELKEA